MKKNKHLVPVIKSVRIASFKSLTTFILMPKGEVRADADFEKIYFTPSSIQLLEEDNTNSNGRPYSYSLNFFFPGLNDYNTEIKLKGFCLDTALIEIEYDFQKKMLMGNDALGALFEYNYDKNKGGYNVRCFFADHQPLLSMKRFTQFFGNLTQPITSPSQILGLSGNNLDNVNQFSININSNYYAIAVHEKSLFSVITTANNDITNNFSMIPMSVNINGVPTLYNVYTLETSSPLNVSATVQLSAQLPQTSNKDCNYTWSQINW